MAAPPIIDPTTNDECEHKLDEMDEYAMKHNCPICVIANFCELANYIIINFPKNKSLVNKARECLANIG